MQAGVQAARLQTLQQHSLRPCHTARSSLAAPLLHRGLAGTARPATAMHAASPGTLCKCNKYPLQYALLPSCSGADLLVFTMMLQKP